MIVEENQIEKLIGALTGVSPYEGDDYDWHAQIRQVKAQERIADALERIASKYAPQRAPIREAIDNKTAAIALTFVLAKLEGEQQSNGDKWDLDQVIGWHKAIEYVRQLRDKTANDDSLVRLMEDVRKAAS